MRAGKIFAAVLSGFLQLSPACLASTPLPLNPFDLKDPLVGEPAPELEISTWMNGEGVSLKELRGKVVILEFFQLWCPGCNKFSIPLMKEWKKIFADEREIVFISIHTVFEGHRINSVKNLRIFIKKKKITHLVGVDRHGRESDIPVTMRRYRTGGTPCMDILDKQGVIRFKYFGMYHKEPITELIRHLLREDTTAQKEPAES